jgi:hypothetical protein
MKGEYRVKQENALKYLMKYFRDSSFFNISKSFAVNFQYGINFRSPSLFEPRTVVLEQLKNLAPCAISKAMNCKIDRRSISSHT